MAEIKIEKKSTSWPWILAGIIALAILFYFLFFQPNAEDKVVKDQDTISTLNTVNTNETGNSAVMAFAAFVENDTTSNDTTSMDLDHNYTNTGLMKLCDATQEVADRTGYEAKDAIDEAREYASKITNDATVTTHADNIKKSTGIISNVLKDIQENSFPELAVDADNVTSASQAISKEELTLDQKGVVKSFFNKASVLLKKMN